MNRQAPNRHLSAGNPIANVIVVLVGALAIGAFIVLGVVAFVALSGIILSFAAVLGIRLWWLGRKSQKRRANRVAHGASNATGNAIIEGEYRVVSTDEKESRAE